MLEVKRLRQEREWNQTELAYHARLAPSVISQIENGKRDPSARTLRKLAAALEVEVGDLFPKGQAPLPEFGETETRREDAYELAWDAARNQVLQTRQATNRALESERPQTYFMTHENDAVEQLSKYPADELAGALLEATRRIVDFENEPVVGAGREESTPKEAGLADADPSAELAPAKALEEIAGLWEEQLARGFYDRRTLILMRRVGFMIAVGHEHDFREARETLPPRFRAQLERAEERFADIGARLWEAQQALEEGGHGHCSPPDELAAKREAKREEFLKQMRSVGQALTPSSTA